jgi:ligand-binding sensor domain-containing protein
VGIEDNDCHNQYRSVARRRITKVLSAIGVIIITVVAFCTMATAQTTSGSPMNGKFVYSLGCDAAGNVFAGTGSREICLMESAANVWTEVGHGLTYAAIYTMTIGPDQTLYVGTDEGVFRSFDNGDHGTPASTGLANTFVNALAVNASGVLFAGTGGGGIFRSADRGNSWVACNEGLSDLVILSLATDGSGRVLAGTDGDGVFWSSDDGASWNGGATGLSNAVIYAGSRGGGVFRSDNHGSSWYPANHGIAESAVYSLAIKPSGALLAGTDSGLFFSGTGGSYWYRANDGSSSLAVLSLAVGSAGTGFAGTNGAGVFLSH